MANHNHCERNCGSTDCTAARRIEAARQAQPLEELQRKADKAERRGLFTQERIDYAKAWARDFLRSVRIE